MRRTLLALRVRPGIVAGTRLLLTPRGWEEKADRFVRQYAYWWGVRQELDDPGLWQRIARPPVILMYHAVGDDREPASTYVIPRRRLRWQMRWLRWRRYNLMPLSELAALMLESRYPPRRTVVLTFDDGYADNYSHAFPILKRHGAPATVFAVSGRINAVADWTPDPALHGRALLTSDQIRELAAGGVEIGAHSRSHASLSDIELPEAQREVTDSRSDLERLLGRTVRTFAYPYGDFNEQLSAAVESAGFQVACCSRSGFVEASTPPYALPRVEVRGGDSLLRFAFMLWTGYRPRPARPSAATRQIAAAGSR